MIQLVALIAIASAAFFITRALANRNHEISLEDAAAWYSQGELALDAGRIDEAVAMLRRAAVRDRGERRYVLGLARALSLRGEPEAATSALLTLRESAPDDPEVNVQLARLAAARRDVTLASRFYHNAIYAPWAIDQAQQRRDLRAELIRFLLANDQNGRALSELLALSADLPDDVPHHVEAGQLFASAGDHARALEQFQRTLALAPDNPTALVGAGESAFALGQYIAAQRYLRRAPSSNNVVASARAIVDLVIARDPLAPRLGAAERRRRLLADLADAEARLTACLAERAPSSNDLSLQTDARGFARDLARSAGLEQDTIETGIDLIDRVERFATERCPPPTALDRALILIGRQHKGESP